MRSKPEILLVEDDPQIVASLTEVLEAEEYSVSVAQSGEAGIAAAASGKFDVVLTDFRLPGVSGLELIRKLHLDSPRLPIILMTAHGTSETAIEATKSGAYDYLLKPFEMPELLAILSRAITNSRMAGEPVALGEEQGTQDALIGKSRPMQEIFKEIGRIAPRDVTVLIRGETGTGKELIARAIYQHSPRARQPFIAVNCAAIPETLLESELFGHEKGSFTGADTRRIGRFEQASGGTLFLDEIGDMSPSTQVKLLRVLQERTVQRVGGKEAIPIDVRVLAATHCDLEQAVADRKFREDLFYRLNVASITLPPLRKRSEDVQHLARYFLRQYATQFGVKEPAITTEALEFLTTRGWPGNVRELENVVRKSLLRARGYPVSLEDARTACAGAREKAGDTEQPLSQLIAGLLEEARSGKAQNVYDAAVEIIERELLSQAMDLTAGNQAQTARWLGLARRTLREKLHRLGLHPAQDGDEQME